MDSKILNNFLRTAQLGSLTSAAGAANLTVQALAAQLNKLEEQFGFKLLVRTNKGVTLTNEGRDILPWVTEVVKAAAELQQRTGQIKQRAAPALHIALNNTFPETLNQALMNYLREILSGRPLLFSSSESPENLAKLASGEADMAVVIGDNTPAGLYSLELSGLKIEVVAAMAGDIGSNEVTLIKPMPECAYSASFSRFLLQYKHRFAKAAIHYSGSELISVSMIKSSNSIGIISRRVAQLNHLTVLPDFNDALNVQLLMKTPLLTADEMAPFYAISLPAMSA